MPSSYSEIFEEVAQGNSHSSRFGQDVQKCRRGHPGNLSVMRATSSFKEPIKSLHLHSFGDAKCQGVCSAVYAVVKQESRTNQGLINAKSRHAK